MGYQALLFCPDEKTARIVTQVLSELDFTVDTAGEPFAAVKKLMAQHFDALVVDCENEQNASLLFRSARNSNANQSSLAVAVVESQAGVAKAFRIGANLVLSKPINVEQSKGTLRVARGLLRKGSEAGKGATGQSSPPSPPLPHAGKSQATKSVSAPGAAASRPSLAPIPGWGSSPVSAAKPESISFTPPATHNAAFAPAFGDPDDDAVLQLSEQEIAPDAREAAEKVSDASGLAPNPPFISNVSRAIGATAAPARELPSSLLAALESSPAALSATREPSFASLDDTVEEKSSFGFVKILGIAVAVAVIAVAAYFGYKHGNRDEEPIAPTASESQPAPVLAAGPVTSATPPSAKATKSLAAFSSPAHDNLAAAKPSPSSKNSSSEEIAEDSTVTLEQVQPIKVKSDLGKSATTKSSPQAEQALPSAPPALNLGSSNPDEKAVSNLVAAPPVSVPKPAPEVLNISQGVTQGMVTKRVQPVYPPQALAMRIQGAVELQATISKDGNIRNVKVISGDGLLSRAAADAVQKWKYKPYYLNGEPVEIQTQITVNFKLPN